MKLSTKGRYGVRLMIDLAIHYGEGTILKDIRTEIWDGKTTFARQIGTYPLIIGIKGRLDLKKFINIRVTGHMLRSIIGEQV